MFLDPLLLLWSNFFYPNENQIMKTRGWFQEYPLHLKIKVKCKVRLMGPGTYFADKQAIKKIELTFKSLWKQFSSKCLRQTCRFLSFSKLALFNLAINFFLLLGSFRSLKKLKVLSLFLLELLVQFRAAQWITISF